MDSKYIDSNKTLYNIQEKKNRCLTKWIFAFVFFICLIGAIILFFFLLKPLFAPKKISISLEKNLPNEITAAIETFVKQNEKYQIVETDADIVIDSEKTFFSKPIFEQIFVLVTNFSSLTDDISSNQWQKILNREIISWQEIDQRDLSINFITDTIGKQLLIKLWPNAKIKYTVVENDKLLIKLVKNKNSLGLIPFDKLNPRLKALSFNQIDILEPKANLKNYPFKKMIYIHGSKSEELKNYLKTTLPSSNRDIIKIATLAQTGVTAITRQSAMTIAAKNDSTYPARVIGPTLTKADLTHISNEIPMYPDCQPPKSGMIFCGKSEYLASFDLLGVDIIGLTGNHLNDFGNEKLLETLKIFKKKKWDYFGGGKNLKEARKILYKEIKGAKIAFLGYNWYDVWVKENRYFNTSALADENTPGANPYSEEQMKKDIETAKQKANIVFVEIQFQESYQTQPTPLQQTVFRKAIDFGADVVVGVQAHQPQKIEFYKNKPIFYGLGNLFFDQMFSPQVRQGLILWHVFYNGKHISTKILTTMLYEFAQPRWATEDQRRIILQSVLP